MAQGPDDSQSCFGCLSILGVLLALGAVGALFSGEPGPFLVLVLILLIVFGPGAVRNWKKRRYFNSEEFKQHKQQIAEVVHEHNEVTNYVTEIRDRGLFELGRTETGAQAHLASFENTSKYKYRRDRHESNFSDPHVHNCSLQVVRNASAQPIKYLMKYFDLPANEGNLERVERLGESVASLSAAIENLQAREVDIAKSINPPPFIMRYFREEFLREVGVDLSPIKVTYPVYAFEYVSAGGNSGQRTTIELNPPTIDALIETMSEKIRFRKSAAGQRALMTTKLRNFIKERDGFACRQCSVALADEPHLLLEVDHIIPVSRGGLSTEENLQTLCWRCNRSKSNKLPE